MCRNIGHANTQFYPCLRYEIHVATLETKSESLLVVVGSLYSYVGSGIASVEVIHALR